MIKINTKNYAIDSVFGICDLNGIEVYKHQTHYSFIKDHVEVKISRQASYISIISKLNAKFNIEILNHL